MLIQDAIFPDLKEVSTIEIVETQREVPAEEFQEVEIPVEKVVRRTTRKTTTTKRKSVSAKRK